VVDGVLGPDVLAMTPVDHDEHLLQQPDDAVAEAGAELDQLGLAQPAGAQATLDVGLVELRLGLGDPAQAVGVDGQQPQGGVVADLGAAEQVGDLQHRDVVLPGPVAGLRRGEPERLVNGPQERQGHAPVGGEPLVGAVKALGGRHHRRVQEHQ
jgi:hypothetical protein